MMTAFRSLLPGALLVSVSALACGPRAEPQSPESAGGCIERLAALDVGSSTTKVKVATVDRCKMVPLEVLWADELPMAYGNALATRSDGRLSEEVQSRGLVLLKELKRRADELKPTRWTAVATASFRAAHNGVAFAARIGRELDLKVTIVEQDEEAQLGFVAAIQHLGASAEEAVVWDVGGRSMQLSAFDAQGRFMVYRGPLSSGQMRDHVVWEVQDKPLSAHAPTPNPMSRTDAEDAHHYARHFASEHLPKAFRDKLAAGGAELIGIGALKYYGDRPAHLEGANCSRRQLEQTASRLVGQSDQEIGGAYASTQLSDRLLILGFMDGLGVERITLADVDLTDGLFASGAYWRPANQRATSLQAR